MTSGGFEGRGDLRVGAIVVGQALAMTFLISYSYASPRRSLGTVEFRRSS